jgi:hypothetical protein
VTSKGVNVASQCAELSGAGRADDSAIRWRRGKEGDYPNEWGPPIGGREETRRQCEIHKPEGKTYSREYANDSQAEWAGWGGGDLRCRMGHRGRAWAGQTRFQETISNSNDF